MKTYVTWIKKNKKNVITIGVISFVVLMNLYLFRGNIKHGLEYDEVYRINNLFPMLNTDVYPYNQSIYSLIIFGIRFPIMYKQYISTASLLPSFIVFLFGDSLFALRCSYMIYSIGLEILVYFSFKKKKVFIAVLSTCFLAVCPILFPYIRYGWASLIYGYFMIIGFYFIKRYKRSGNRINLFLSVYSFALLVNVQFYALWIIGGILFTTIIFYPTKSLLFIKSIKNVIVSLCAIALGLFHFLAYNIAMGFPSLMTLINYLFHPDTYNANAIDNRITTSLWESFGPKLKSYIDCIKPMSQLYLYLLLALLLIYLICFIKTIKDGKLQKKKKYFAPLVATIISFVFMLVSPNSENSHHLTFIVIFLCVTISVGLWLLYSSFGIKKKYISILAAIILLFNFYQCNTTVNKNIASNGNGYFTETIFDLVDYVQDESSIDDTNILFVEWGFSSQFYFLNKGKFKIKDITYSIMDKTDEEREKYFDTLFPTLNVNELYVPVYYNKYRAEYTYRELTDADIYALHAPVQSFVNYVIKNNGIVRIQEWFPDDDGNEIVLLKIEEIDEIKKSLEYYNKINYDIIKISSFHKNDNYEYLSGFYDYEANSGIRWAKKRSQLFLFYDNQQFLRIQYWAPSLEQRDHETRITVRINNQTVYSEEVKFDGFHTIQLEMNKIIGHIMPGPVDIKFSISSQIINTSDSRQLGCCINYIEFVNDE